MNNVRVLLAALWFCTIGVLAGCGVSAQTSAEPATQDAVPFGLLDADRTPVADPRPAGTVTAAVYLYSEADERLHSVEHRLDSSDLGTVLTVLEEELSATDRHAGLTSVLSEAESISDVEVSGGVATLDLHEKFTDLDGSDQLIALAQIVYTATARPGVGQVAFTLDGEPIEIPTGDGALTSSAVTAEDYAGFSPAG